ncbi:YraN family protein [Pollutimonas harenae]|uniref:UPF0102 protein H0A62_01310 n=1 Tax=Pollutimonas harenae TaxID=657015 RepID=A0A853GMJ7_9BURK|nr:YraN family protein [Pollutimonas harenae]NYT84228.1 YraN family protein [Pollutimonas harenae]TEA73358.1 YraN family protein [Pollutimonas harenae]
MDDETLPYQLARAAQQKTIRARRRKQALPPTTAATGTEPQWSPSQKTGRRAEELACQYLQARGLVVLARNLHSKTGEIDLIANDHGILVFIEVRHRCSRRYGGAAASVNRDKQQRLTRTAQYFLPMLARRFFRGRVPACRFDVVAVEPLSLSWIRGAFGE